MNGRMPMIFLHLQFQLLRLLVIFISLVIVMKFIEKIKINCINNQFDHSQFKIGIYDITLFFINSVTSKLVNFEVNPVANMKFLLLDN